MGYAHFLSASAAEKNRSALVLRLIIFAVSLGMNLLHTSLHSAHQAVSGSLSLFCESFSDTQAGELIFISLRQRRDHLLRLQTHWTTPLVSSLRFTSHARDALKIAITLSGGSQTPTMCWLSVTSLEVAEGEPDDMQFAEPHDLPVVESEHTALTDVLEGDADREEVGDFDLMDYVTDTHAVIVWEVPEVRVAILLIILVIIGF
jgi:hypothetical protein